MAKKAREWQEVKKHLCVFMPNKKAVKRRLKKNKPMKTNSYFKPFT